MTPANWYKLTDGIINPFTELQNSDVLYGVDKSDLTQDPQGTSKRLSVGLLVNYILSQVPDYIPLAGTTELEPVSGPLIFSDNFYVGNRAVGSFSPQARVGFSGSNLSLLALEPGVGNVGIQLDANPLSLEPYALIYSTVPNFPGLEYQDDYSSNFKPNTLITKQWVEDYIASLPSPSGNQPGVITISAIPLNTTTLNPAFIGYVVVPYDCEITGWFIFGTDENGEPQTGSAQIDIYRDTYANHPPTSSDTIFSGNNPQLSSQNKNALGGLAIPLLEFDVLRVQLTSSTGLSRIYVSLITQPF